MNRLYACLKLFFALVLFLQSLNAQEKDTLATKDASVKETTDLQNIKTFSKKSKVTSWLHQLLFRKTPALKNATVEQTIIKKQINYKNFQNKIIRKIIIETLDPFGFSVSDTLAKPTNHWEKFGNKLHIKSQNFTIKNLLLFKRNQTLDSIQIEESERILRGHNFIRRVSIEPKTLANSPDSVDVTIRVLDSWSINGSGEISPSNLKGKISFGNFAGLGHYFAATYKKNFSYQLQAYKFEYYANNIANTFVNTGAIYDKDLYENNYKTLYVNRPFYSQLTKWAGGILVNETFYRDSVSSNLALESKLQNFKTSYLDTWIGYSHRIFKNKPNEKKITNFITTLRYFNSGFTQRPSSFYDPLDYYSGSELYLASWGLYSFNYIQDRFIFNYDQIEDIAEGKIASLTLGLQHKNELYKPYLASRLAYGKYFRFGYLGAELQWGSFIYDKGLFESVFRWKITYFSKILLWNKWRFRQFFNSEFVYGYNRIDYDKDRISLNGTNGIDGFYSYHLRGTKKLLMHFQTQSYAPMQWLGFRLSPFVTATFGLLGDQNDKIFNPQIYASFGAGIVISNDYITFSNIQLSFVFLPYIPEHGHNIYRFNTLRNNNFRMQNFRYGKPEMVPFR